MVTEKVLNNDVAGVMVDGATCFLMGNDSRVCNGDFDGLATETVITYKRRKSGGSSSESKLTQFQKLSSVAVSQSEDEVVKEVVDLGLQEKSCEQVLDPRINCCPLSNGSDDCSHNRRSKLQNLYELVFEDESKVQAAEGLHYLSSKRTDSVQVAKGAESLKYLCHAHLASTTSRISSEVEGNAILNADEPFTHSKNLNITNQCYYAFRRIVMSEKYASMHKLITESFPGVEAHKVLDFSVLKSRMKEGVYEKSPACFLSDIQLTWRKLHVIGSEMVSLAKSMSELSRLFCREVGENMDRGMVDYERQELSGPSLDWADRWKQPDEIVFKSSTCGECRKRSDGRDCLVCDSCEEMFHVSCIRPVITEIPPMNWYCASCTALELQSLHDDCVVCENLHNPTGTSESGGEKISSHEEAIGELENSACVCGYEIQTFKGHKRVHCKVCKSTLEHNDLFRVCEHHLCKKYYHVRCLSNGQLKSYCPRWYCPSCLCRVCLVDKDDDKIVLCDACDHGYHIYCMNPPLDSIPKGTWFCRKCNLGLQVIHKAKMAYKSLENKRRGRVEGRTKICGRRGRKPEQVGVELVGNRSEGGVEMLLSAADAISCQEVMSGLYPELTIPTKRII